ncbi:MAG: MobA/MobL family protein, partial [Oscillospiraceae bacterium]|nr:MobA/MobL family protein [Oscillospiraceae bacterium]
MAIYHLAANVVMRGVGRTACGAAAYMSCSKLYNDYDGIQHDYTRKGGLVWERVFLPPMAPAEWQDREALWNAVEANEKTKDSQLAREFIVALPVELERSEWVGLVSEFIQENFVSDGMCADVAIHNTDGQNPHAHILLTMRPLNQDGTWQYKTEKEYLCVRDGEERGFTAAEFKTAQGEGWEKQYPYKVGKKKVYMTPSAAETRGLERMSKYPKSTKYGRQNPITARWNSEEQLIAWRAAWADVVNRALERSGVEQRVDHRSHAERGLDEKPTIHEGYEARRMEKAGFVSERCELNRQIRADNALIRELKAAVVKLAKAVVTTVAEIARALETIRQNIIVFNYGLLHIRKRRGEAREYLSKAKPAYDSYTDLAKKIADKESERQTLQNKLALLPVLNISKRRELKGKIAELSEEIGELDFTKMEIVRGFGKEQDSDMAGVKAYLSTIEANADKMDAQEARYNGKIKEAKREFDRLKEQATDLDQDELTDARLVLRPQMEREAQARIRKAEGGREINL